MRSWQANAGPSRDMKSAACKHDLGHNSCGSSSIETAIHVGQLYLMTFHSTLNFLDQINHGCNPIILEAVIHTVWHGPLCIPDLIVVCICTFQMAKEHDSVATIWTNDNHSSYLNSIEAMFVGSLHMQRLHAMDVNKRLGSAGNCEEDFLEFWAYRDGLGLKIQAETRFTILA